MLGTVIGLTNLVRSNSIIKVLQNRIPSSFLDINKEALNLGIELGAKVKS